MSESHQYERLATQLLESPQPVRAIAAELADQAARIDALLRRVHALECRPSSPHYPSGAVGPEDGWGPKPSGATPSATEVSHQR